jgi:hypothetical protein
VPVAQGEEVSGPEVDAELARRGDASADAGNGRFGAVLALAPGDARDEVASGEARAEAGEAFRCAPAARLAPGEAGDEVASARPVLRC